MSEEPTDAVSPAPTRRSTQAARPVPPPLPPTASVAPSVSPVVPTSVVGAAAGPAEAGAALESGMATPSVTDVEDARFDASAAETDAAPELAWAPPAPRQPPALAGWALAVAIVGLLVSLVVGWGFPVGIIAIVTAIAALRRPDSRRQAAGWALALGILSVLYSALWIAVAVSRGPLF